MALIFYERVGHEGRRPSPFSWRIRYALAHKGLDFEVRPVRFAYTLAAVAGALDFDRTRLKTKRSTEFMDSAFLRSPKFCLKLRTEEATRSYAGELSAPATLSRTARIPMMVAFRLTPIRRDHPGKS